MAALALAEALQDFGRPASRKPAGGPASEDPLMAVVKEFTPAEPERPPEPDHAEILKREVAAAEAGLAERLEKEHAAALEDERARHAAVLDELNARMGAQAGETIAARLDEMEARILDTTAQVVARILGVALTEDLQQRTVEKLREAVNEAVRDREAARIRITGPLSLFESLRAGLGRHADKVDYTESAAFDLTVTVDDSIIETRLGEWSAAVAEALE